MLQIGTTRRGIGPAYADKAARVGIRVQDLLDRKILREKIVAALSVKNDTLRARVRGRAARRRAIVARRSRVRGRGSRRYVADTSLLIAQALARGESVLCEGAQGTLLDLDHGTYPFVTSLEPDRRRRLRRARLRADARSPRSSASPRPISHASARGRSRARPTPKTTTRCARRAASSAPRPGARGAAAGSISSACASRRA